MRISFWSLAALALLTSCAQLDDIPSDVCGNNVVEPARGEQCDGSTNCGAADSANACFFTCDVDQQCPEANDGNGDGIADPWVCGTDLRCRQPGTSFASRVQIARDTAASFDIRDVDGDDRDDIIAKDSNGVVITYGDGTRTLGESQRVKSAADVVGPEFIDADSDGRLDMAYAAPGRASLLLQQDDRTMKPAQQVTFDATTEAGTTCRQVEYTSLYTRDDSVLSKVPLYFSRDIDGNNASIKIGSGASITINSGPVDGDFVGVSIYTSRRSGTNYIAVAYSKAVRVFRYDNEGLAPGARLTFPSGVALTLSARIAIEDDQGDRCPDILITDETQALSYANTKSSGPNCSGEVAGSAGTFDNLTMGGTKLDLMVSDGPAVKQYYDLRQVLGYNGNQIMFGRYTNIGALINAGTVNGNVRAGRFVDYNKDGFDDIAIISSDSVLDLFLNIGNNGFNHFVVDLPSAARTLEVGDVDGDTIEDIILTLKSDDNDDGPKVETVVAYGDLDGRIDELVSAGVYAGPITVRLDTNNRISDIVISQNPDSDTCSRPITIIPGDTSRTLAASLQLPTQLINKFVNITGSGAPQLAYFATEKTGSGQLIPTYSGILGVDVPGKKGLFLAGNSTSVELTGDFKVYGIANPGYVHNAATPPNQLNLSFFTTGYCIAGDFLCPYVDAAVVDVGKDGPIPFRIPNPSRLRTFLYTESDPEQASLPRFFDFDGDGLDDLFWLTEPMQDGQLFIEAYRNSTEGFTTEVGESVAFPLPNCDLSLLRFDEAGSTNGLVSFTTICRKDSGNVTELVHFLFDAEANSFGVTGKREVPAGIAEFRFGDFDGDRIQDFAIMGPANINVYYGCDLIEEASGTDCVSFLPL